MQHAPHLVPDDIAVHGRGDALVDEAEFRVERQQPFLARQDDALAPLGFRVGNDACEELPCTALAAMGRRRHDGEDHLPRAVRVVPFGMVVHLIREVALIRHEAVDEREDFSARISLRRQQPEMVGVMREPSADALGRRPLGGQIRRRLNGAERLPVIFRCMPDSRARFHSFA